MQTVLSHVAMRSGSDIEGEDIGDEYSWSYSDGESARGDIRGETELGGRSRRRAARFAMVDCDDSESEEEGDTFEEREEGASDDNDAADSMELEGRQPLRKRKRTQAAATVRKKRKV